MRFSPPKSSESSSDIITDNSPEFNKEEEDDADFDHIEVNKDLINDLALKKQTTQSEHSYETLSSLSKRRNTRIQCLK